MITDQQLKHNDCGISAVKTIFNLYDIPISRKSIERNIHLNQNGSRISDIKAYLSDVGLTTKYNILDVHHLSRNIKDIEPYLPCIVPVQNGRQALHYIVVESLKRNKLVVLDPSQSSRSLYTIHELQSIAHHSTSTWEGVSTKEIIASMCREELRSYNVSFDDALGKNKVTDVFNKLTYFSYIRDNYAFKDSKIERDFLVDLLHNQDISLLPKNFRSSKLDTEKIKIKAPLALTVTAGAKTKLSEPSPVNKDHNVYIALFKELGGNKKLWYQYILAALFSALITNMAIFTNQMLIDYVLPSFQLSVVIQFAIGIGLFKLFDMATSLHKTFIGIKVSYILDKYFFEAFDRKLNTFSMAYINSFRKGDITERMSDSLKLKTFFTSTFTNLLIEAFVVVYTMALLFYFDWKLSMVICTAILLLVIWFKIITPYIKRNEQKRFVLKADFFSKILEKIDGIQVIKSFNLNETSSDKINASIREVLKIHVSNKYIGVVNFVVVSLIGLVASVYIVVRLSEGLIIDNAITLGQIITFFALSNRVFSSSKTLLNQNLSLQENEVILKRYFDFNDTSASSQRERTYIDRNTIVQLEINNLSFGYFPGEAILDGINISARSGDKIQIIGENGSGKSTLSKIICSLYHQTSGEVLLNGISHLEYRQDILNEKIVLVSNEDILFNDTIRYNVVFDNDVSTGRIMQAAKDVNLYDFIKGKEDGLDFVVTENGKNLSTGQRKKILLMRALLSNADVIILDEVLSGIDHTSRNHIEEVVNQIRDKIIIVISHEPISYLNFTQKIHLENGQIKF